jgi:hypothetical protein
MASSDEFRELRDDEIDGVTGGLVVNAIIAVCVPKTSSVLIT